MINLASRDIANGLGRFIATGVGLGLLIGVTLTMTGVYRGMSDDARAFRIRRNEYTVVGLTRRMVTFSGDPIVFIPLRDAQGAQFLKDNEAIHNDRGRLAENPRINRPGSADTLEAVSELLTSNRNVNAVLVRIADGWSPREVADTIKRWKHLQAFTDEDMEEILVGTVIARAARQIGLFLVILSFVSAAIVGFIIYSMTMAKLREIAVLKLIGTRNRTIAAMILQQALALGVIGFLVGRIAATLWGPVFPRYVLLLGEDTVRAFVLTMLACALASLIGIRVALRVDPAQAIGG